jgi:hypothetical protein
VPRLELLVHGAKKVTKFMMRHLASML